MAGWAGWQKIISRVRENWSRVRQGARPLFTASRRRPLFMLGAAVIIIIYFVFRPPVGTVAPGMAGVRINRLTGSIKLLPDGPVLVLPLVHELRQYSLRDQVYRTTDSALANSPNAFQSVEGLSVGIDVTVRYAVDPKALEYVARRLPLNVGPELIHPMVQGVLHRRLAQRTVRDIFTGKRAQIQQEAEEELKKLLIADGVLVRAVLFGHVDLPADYRRSLESRLAEELAAERMQYTLQVRQKEIEEKKLVGEAEKATRTKAAEAAALEEVIAAKGKEEAMSHILPFKKREIEQRRLEAEAQKVQRRTVAEGEAEAKKIESRAEADARRTLAEADAYRSEVTSKAQLSTMARESELLAQNPLLIQKVFAEKMSERLQVIIAPPSAGNGFFAANLLGSASAAAPRRAPAAKATDPNASAASESADNTATEESP